MWLYIKVKKDKGKEIISDIKFKTFGCAAAIATSSMVTQLAKGKTIQEAEKIKYDEVMKSLGGLPRVKVHCSMMAQEALKLAIKDYNKNGKNKNIQTRNK
jgi:nitrogen fixation NifU-like protein